MTPEGGEVLVGVGCTTVCVAVEAGSGVEVNALMGVAMRGIEVKVCIDVCVKTTVCVEVDVGKTGATVAVCVTVGLDDMEIGGSASGQPDPVAGKSAGSPPGGNTYTGDGKFRNAPRSLPAGTICAEPK